MLRYCLLALLVTQADTKPFRSKIIPLFTRELASSIGHELECIDPESKTHYDGRTVCVISSHGQRSVCSFFTLSYLFIAGCLF